MHAGTLCTISSLTHKLSNNHTAKILGDLRISSLSSLVNFIHPIIEPQKALVTIIHSNEKGHKKKDIQKKLLHGGYNFLFNDCIHNGQQRKRKQKVTVLSQRSNIPAVLLFGWTLVPVPAFSVVSELAFQSQALFPSIIIQVYQN